MQRLGDLEISSILTQSVPSLRGACASGVFHGWMLSMAKSCKFSSAYPTLPSVLVLTRPWRKRGAFDIFIGPQLHKINAIQG